jgi:hypothetical protein
VKSILTLSATGAKASLKVTEISNIFTRIRSPAVTLNAKLNGTKGDTGHA